MEITTEDLANFLGHEEGYGLYNFDKGYVQKVKSVKNCFRLYTYPDRIYIEGSFSFIVLVAKKQGWL